MATVIYSAAMSLDGFIAGPGGDMSWLGEFLAPDPGAEDLMRRTTALLVGRRTFDGDDPNRDTDAEGPFGGAWSGPQVVLTHRVPTTPSSATTFVDDLDEALRRATEAAGSGVVSVLGADVARQCLDAGRLDEVLVFVVPVLLGEGVRLLDRPGRERVRLERAEAVSGSAALRYRVLR